MKNQTIKALFSLILIAVLLLSGGLGDSLKGMKAFANEADHITISIERFTLARGYYQEPVQIPMPGSISVRQALGAVSQASWAGERLIGITGAQVSSVSIPTIISKMEAIEGDLPPNDGRAMAYGIQSASALSNGDYSAVSQWMISINNHLSIGVDQTLVSGDVLRVQFSLWGHGADLKQASGDKTTLNRLIASLKADPSFQAYLGDGNFEAAYYQALAAAGEYACTQATIDQASDRLKAAIPLSVNDIKFHEETLELGLRDQAVLGITILADGKVEKRDLLWESSDPSVVSVDANGAVIGQSPGTAIISAKSLFGSVADSCRITVRAIPIREISLSAETLLLEVGESYGFGVSYYPENTTDLKVVTWTSSANEIAEISPDGVLFAKKVGRLDLVARSQSGAQATCWVQIESAKGLATEIDKRIGDLPTVGQLKFSDRDILLKVKDDYEKLSQKAKNLVDFGMRDKLEQLLGRLISLEENQRIADEIISGIDRLPSKETLSLEDESRIQALLDRYHNEINQERQALISKEHLEKLVQAEKRIAQIKRENQLLANQVMAMIADLPLEAQVHFSDYELIAEIRSSLNQLVDQQKNLVLNTNKFNGTEERLVKLIEEAIKDVDRQDVSLQPREFKNFILASKAYEGMTESQKNRIDEELKNHLFEIQAVIKAENNKSNGIRIDLPFHIRLKTKIIQPEAIVFKEAQEQMGGALVKLYEISFEDLYHYGLEVSLADEDLEIAINLEDKNQADFLAVVISKSGVIKTYDGDKEREITFKAGDFAYLGLASNSIAINAIDLPLAEGLNEEVDQSFKETASYLLTATAKPTIQAGSWETISFARGSYPVPKGYYDLYYNNVLEELSKGNGKLSGGAVSTDYAKTILALTAIGKDPRNVGGYNLLVNLSDFEQIKRGGMMSYVWALMALDSGDYEIPLTNSGRQASRELLLQTILGREVVNAKGVRGGFSLFDRVNGQPETDVTAIVLQALAKYKDQEEIKPVIDRGLKVLSKLQHDNGGYGAFNAPETSESTAQVILALTALGIDPAKDVRFIKGENWLLGELMTYSVDGGGFMHVKPDGSDNGGAFPGKINGMASNQASQAIIAYKRLLEGKNWIFAMSDGTELIFDPEKSLEDLEEDYENSYESQGGESFGGSSSQLTAGGSGVAGSSAGGMIVSGGSSAGGGLVSSNKKENAWVFEPEMASNIDKKNSPALESELLSMNQQKTIGLIGGGTAILILIITLIIIKKKKLGA